MNDATSNGKRNNDAFNEGSYRDRLTNQSDLSIAADNPVNKEVASDIEYKKIISHSSSEQLINKHLNDLNHFNQLADLNNAAHLNRLSQFSLFGRRDKAANVSEQPPKFVSVILNQFDFIFHRDTHLIHSFNQVGLCNQVAGSPEQFKTLASLDMQYNGLCEIVCNYVIANDLLGNSAKKSVSPQSPPISEVGVIAHVEGNPLKLKINIEGLNQKAIRRSHVLKNYNIFYKLAAVFFGFYPNSIIPFNKEIANKNGVNKIHLKTALDKLAVGDYVKFETFKRDGIYLEGHSMLIKKTSEDSYSYFDPNKGEYQDLTIDKLCVHINNARDDYGDRIAFMDAKAFFQDIGFKPEAISAQCSLSQSIR